MTLPAAPLGFAGDPDSWITTAEVAARLGFMSIRTFYNDKPNRDASGFPSPRRRGLFRLGDLQDWAAKAPPSPHTSAAKDASPAAPGGADAAEASAPPSLTVIEGNDRRGPRPEVLARLQALRAQ